MSNRGCRGGRRVRRSAKEEPWDSARFPDVDLDHEIDVLRRARRVATAPSSAAMRRGCALWAEQYLRQLVEELDPLLCALQLHSHLSDEVVWGGPRRSDDDNADGTAIMHLAASLHASPAIDGDAGTPMLRWTSCGIRISGTAAQRGHWQSMPQRRCSACDATADEFAAASENARWTTILPATHGEAAVTVAAGAIVAMLAATPADTPRHEWDERVWQIAYDALAGELSAMIATRGEPWLAAQLGSRYADAVRSAWRQELSPPLTERLTADAVAWFLRSSPAVLRWMDPDDGIRDLLYRTVIGAHRHGGITPTTVKMIHESYVRLDERITAAMQETHDADTFADVFKDVELLPVHLGEDRTAAFLEQYLAAARRACARIVTWPEAGRVNSVGEQVAADAILNATPDAIQAYNAIAAGEHDLRPLDNYECQEVLDDVETLFDRADDVPDMREDDNEEAWSGPLVTLGDTDVDDIDSWFQPLREHAPEPPDVDAYFLALSWRI